MVLTGTFPNGVLNDQGSICREFILEERTFRHALEVGSDGSIKKELLSSPVYYDALVLSKRLKIAGIDRLTPEQVLELDAEDGDTLVSAMLELDQRRADFRREQQATPQTPAGAA